MCDSLSWKALSFFGVQSFACEGVNGQNVQTERCKMADQEGQTPQLERRKVLAAIGMLGTAAAVGGLWNGNGAAHANA